ncbi:MAG: GntR family transcriptional regulator, partial [Pseudomonadota bacterium]
MEESHQNSVADPAETLNGAESASSASITSRAYARLKDDIISGALPPGSKLKIEKLRKTYNAGTSPIREALSLLTSDHLVERIDQRGFRVAISGTYLQLLKSRYIKALPLGRT